MHCELSRHGKRRVVEIVTPSGRIAGSHIDVATIFALDAGTLTHTGTLPPRTTKFEAAGFDPGVVFGVAGAGGAGGGAGAGLGRADADAAASPGTAPTLVAVGGAS